MFRSKAMEFSTEVNCSLNLRKKWTERSVERGLKKIIGEIAPKAEVHAKYNGDVNDLYTYSIDIQCISDVERYSIVLLLDGKFGERVWIDDEDATMDDIGQHESDRIPWESSPSPWQDDDDEGEGGVTCPV